MGEQSQTESAGSSSSLSPCLLVSLSQRITGIEMLVVDVDGVLTDGGIIYGDNEVEIKSFHVRDGSGLKLWQRAGKRAGLITGRTSPLVDVRAAEIGIHPVFQGAPDKLPAYRRLLSDCNVRPEQVCYVGDDIPDLPIMHNCGLAVAVADACPDVLADAHYVTHARGGRGAVREVVELILRCQGHWQPLVDRLRNAKI